MATISETDLRAIISLRKDGVLADIDPHRLTQQKGVIVVPCADGDQMPDVFAQQAAYAEQAGLEPRPHVLALNGGALLLPENSPLNKAVREDLVLLKHIKDAVPMKNIHTVVIYTHAPCGAAGAANLSFVRCMDLLVKAKARIKEKIPEVKVACFCHVDRSDEGGHHKRRTYYVDEVRWHAWILENAASLS